jgi:hypothetical protein
LSCSRRGVIRQGRWSVVDCLAACCQQASPPPWLLPPQFTADLIAANTADFIVTSTCVGGGADELWQRHPPGC